MTFLSDGFAPPAASGHADGLRARAITDPDDRERLTLVRVEDCRQALARGLKEYLEPLTINWAGGRALRFELVHVAWAMPEDMAKYPSLAVVADMPGEYRDSQMTGRTLKVGDREGGPQPYLRQTASFYQEFHLVVWATDPVQRSGLVSLLEDALEPADFMTGLRLELPYYFGARATFEKKQVMYQDNPSTAITGRRMAIVVVSGEVPQYVPVGMLAPGRAVVQLDVQDSQPGASPASRLSGALEGVEIDDRAR